jgi:hypothetical protein
MVMTLVFLKGKFLNMTVGNPIPWGCPEGCSIFFSEKWPKLEILAFWRVSRHPQPMAQCFQVAPGLGKSEAQNYGLRPPPWASEMPRGPAWTLKIVPWAGGVGSWWLIGEKVVNVLSFDSNLKEKNRKAKIENKWTGLKFVEIWRKKNIVRNFGKFSSEKQWKDWNEQVKFENLEKISKWTGLFQ